MLSTVSLPTQRVALVVQYLGTHFHGWQRQLHQRTVQEEIETVLGEVLNRPVVIHAAGRTDAGVHAAAQVVHFDAPLRVPPHRWADILNSRLSKDVLVRASASVKSNWHARFSAIWRRYRYTIYTDPTPNIFVQSLSWHYYYTPLEESLMQAALTPLLGRHHLTSFHRTRSGRSHSWVDVQAADCVRQGPFVCIEVQANGFLYGMMRLLVGLLVQVGRGVRSPESFTQLWQEGGRDEVKYAAPAHGLCLLRVGYPECPFPPEIWYDAQPKFLFGSPLPVFRNVVCSPEQQ
ncbi:tRNA pseudouridine(38-40) synthase TruA [Leptolyngbya sp. 'hensonii']|uniref:tRNA pseudouridine(38-40) synthase TruA n=1 Tax=Leptolyngbya sp. 'hensonii' TaxID=1922337 RepID=UPI00209B94A8|nr:tRNA pseudouridine(38-40) synthase TruA [Leptolyngbya sp. 'hensonii']